MPAGKAKKTEFGNSLHDDRPIRRAAASRSGAGDSLLYVCLVYEGPAILWIVLKHWHEATNGSQNLGTSEAQAGVEPGANSVPRTLPIKLFQPFHVSTSV